VFQALTTGMTATIQIVSDTPRFEFPLNGAGNAATEALRQCVSSQSEQNHASDHGDARQAVAFRSPSVCAQESQQK
jgi:hypothetical protein